ncbi:membrane protease YdiL (CAAX protease family) [Sinomonas atrocyanea]|uniref:CPBP family glutamic-type intramembrane protease n=1 Tax=Sinomonas atrocyanea TaxID=37927 RepID=UPI00278A7026|nr:CPBP family glutamic-type intramembrane protease [Sinomonas atrocyanea]MDQ0261069.1 membrane protease YdiL (CAAX protease family) [Sinomonas atrocyanea]
MVTKTRRRVPRLVWAGLGLVAAVLCGWTVEAAAAARLDPALLGVAAYVLVWVPLVLGLALSFAGETLRDAAAFLGLRFRPMDLLWGVGIGCLARAADALVRMAATGSTGLAPQPTLSSIGGLGVQAVALGIIAPVVIAPVLEETYFRGLVLRSLAGALGRLSAPARWATAVVITAAAFALVHALLLAGTPGEAVLTGVSTFLFALLAGAVAAATRRLGGAIVGHVVFNGLGVLLTWAV